MNCGNEEKNKIIATWLVGRLGKEKALEMIASIVDPLGNNKSIKALYGSYYIESRK